MKRNSRWHEEPAETGEGQTEKETDFEEQGSRRNSMRKGATVGDEQSNHVGGGLIVTRGVQDVSEIVGGGPVKSRIAKFLETRKQICESDHHHRGPDRPAEGGARTRPDPGALLNAPDLSGGGRGYYERQGAQDQDDVVVNYLASGVENQPEENCTRNRESESHTRPEAGCGCECRHDTRNLNANNDAFGGHLLEDDEKRDGLEQFLRAPRCFHVVTSGNSEAKESKEPDANGRQAPRVLRSKDEVR